MSLPGIPADVPSRPSGDPAGPRPALPPPPPSPARRGRLGTGDLVRLWRLVEGLDASMGDDPPTGNVLLYLSGPAPDAADAAELGWLDLGDRCPVDALAGFVAPDSWRALGFSLSGYGEELDTGGRPRRPQGWGRKGPERTRLRVTSLVGRSGHTASVLRIGDRSRPLAEAPSGQVGDSVLRALGLPTAPPHVTTEALWTCWWLDRVTERACRRDGRSPTWADVAGLHPASPLTLPEVVPSTADVVASTRALATRWAWPRLRTDPDAAAGLARPGPAGGPPRPIPDLPPAALAAWMDDGMYARWLLAAYPPLADLVDACANLVPEGPMAAVRAVVEGTLGPEWASVTAWATTPTATEATEGER